MSVHAYYLYCKVFTSYGAYPGPGFLRSAEASGKHASKWLKGCPQAHSWYRNFKGVLGDSFFIRWSYEKLSAKNSLLAKNCQKTTQLLRTYLLKSCDLLRRDKLLDQCVNFHWLLLPDSPFLFSKNFFGYNEISKFCDVRMTKISPRNHNRKFHKPVLIFLLKAFRTCSRIP